MIFLPISLTVAAAAALLNIWIATRVGKARQRDKVSVGDGGSDFVTRRMRAHANFVEYTPFALILIVLLELSIGQSVILWAAGVLFLLGRVAHAIGMDNDNKGRMVGTIITLLGLAALALGAIYVAYSHKAPVAVTETVTISR